MKKKLNMSTNSPHFLPLKRILGIILLLFFCSTVSAQKTLTFWTDQNVTGPIKIYYNGSYAGSITRGYSSFPGCYAYGCVTVTVKGTGNTWKAVADDGTEWSSSSETLHAECTGMRLYCRSRQNTTSPTPRSAESSNGQTNPYVGDGGGGGYAVAGAAIAFAAIAVAAMEVCLNSDFYVSGTVSSRYGGLEFGFRNNWNRHISFEQTVVWRYRFLQPIPHFLHTDNFETPTIYDYNSNSYYYAYNYYRSNWGCNFRLIYNFFDRDRVFAYTNYIVNPYVGFGCDFMADDGFFTSAVAGFTFGSRRVKLDCRYTFGYDFRNRSTVANQLQLGLIVAYQYKRLRFFRRNR